MKISQFLLILILLGSTSAWSDDWSKKNKDDFNVKTDDVDDFVNTADPETTPPVKEVEIPEQTVEPVEQIEPVKPVEDKKDAKKTKTEAVKKSQKDLKSTPAKRASGAKVDFAKIAIFSCRNILNQHFLFNKKQTAHCAIKDAKDFAFIAKKIGSKDFGKDSVIFESCPDEMAMEKDCNPKLLRNF